MSHFKPGSLSEQVEVLVDQHSLLDVLVALELACQDKADHIRENWQDKALARRWQNASRAIEKVARSAAVQSIP